MLIRRALGGQVWVGSVRGNASSFIKGVLEALVKLPQTGMWLRCALLHSITGKRENLRGEQAA